MSQSPGPNDWQEATVVALNPASENILQVTIRPEIWLPFRAGQHIDVRLTAEDGYQASRSYSIASAPDRGQFYDLLIERLPDGEVSGFFHEAAEPGANLEIKGPVGGHFVWEDTADGAILAIAGGSGLAPILSMIRHRRAAASRVSMHLVYATRFAAQLVALEELRSCREGDPAFGFDVFLSREAAQSPQWHNSRISPDSLAEIVERLPTRPALVYICGSNQFAEVAISALTSAGVPTGIILVERFGGAVQ